LSQTARTFEIDAALDREIAEAALRVVEADHAVALTGAGLSVESGIPPFRGPGGLWETYGEPPMDGYQRFLADPAAAWRERLNPSEAWMRGLVETLDKARPNAGHRALVTLESAGFLKAVITQNIDDLHRQAGSQRVLEIHGNARWLRCLGCSTRFSPTSIEIDPDRLPPHCPECGAVVKGDTVQFGEPIPEDVMAECVAETEQADCMLVVGTSATVYPAASFPHQVAARGGELIEVNPLPSELTPAATVSLRGPAGAVTRRLAEHCAAQLGAEVNVPEEEVAHG